MTQAYISFGSNVGDRIAYINQALACLTQADDISVTTVSSLYETEPVGDGTEDWFINGVIAVKTNLSPHRLLETLKRIEKRMGRQQRERWGPREIDLDLLIYERCCINTPHLIVPHPEMHRRQFVLVPFVEIAPHVIHPRLNRSIKMLLEHLTPEKTVRLAVGKGWNENAI